jgi:hypothetical protein
VTAIVEFGLLQGNLQRAGVGCPRRISVDPDERARVVYGEVRLRLGDILHPRRGDRCIWDSLHTRPRLTASQRVGCAASIAAAKLLCRLVEYGPPHRDKRARGSIGVATIRTDRCVPNEVASAGVGVLRRLPGAFYPLLVSEIHLSVRRRRSHYAFELILGFAEEPDAVFYLLIGRALAGDAHAGALGRTKLEDVPAFSKVCAVTTFDGRCGIGKNRIDVRLTRRIGDLIGGNGRISP